jgi:putative lipoic acid-binding regulatory protein
METFPDRLNQLLNEQHRWPCAYTFKFIVERSYLDRVTALFPNETPVLRPSKAGAYVGVTFSCIQENAESVIEVYHQASRIPRLIAL